MPIGWYVRCQGGEVIGVEALKPNHDAFEAGIPVGRSFWSSLLAEPLPDLLLSPRHQPPIYDI
eukprot:510300-Rhodomonas_salina.1